MAKTVAISFELTNSQYEQLLQLAEIESSTPEQILVRAITNFISKEN